MTTPTTPSKPYQVKYEGRVGKTLRAFCDRHADKIVEMCGGGGYASDSGFAYDALLRTGWRMSDDSVHTIIEYTVADMLRELRGITKCDCSDCKLQARHDQQQTGAPIPAWL